MLPSRGSLPDLDLLEELGICRAASAAAQKTYSITEKARSFERQPRLVDAIFGRMPR